VKEALIAKGGLVVFRNASSAFENVKFKLYRYSFNSTVAG
jgi:hypothetical protein